MSEANGKRYAIVIIGVLFFIFGFVTWMNSTLIPFLKIACELETDLQAFLVTFAFYLAYFFLAIPSAAILKRVGFKKGMALGLFIMALGCIIFIPAANSRIFGIFLVGLFVQGMGLALLQTASNPYVSVLGPIESAAKRISIMGICNKAAGALSPIILSAVLLNGAELLEKKIATSTDATARAALLDELSSRVIVPYLIMTAVLILLSFLILRSSLPEINTDGDEEVATTTRTQKSSVLQYPHLVLGVICLFVYVGVEVLAGDAIGRFGAAEGMPLSQTRYFTSFTLVAMLVGYIAGIIAIPKYLSQQGALRISAILGCIFSILVFVTSGKLSITFIALLGLSNALMWPAIFPLAIAGLGKFTKIGSALLVMGIVGGALFPLLYGYLKDEVNLSNGVSFLLVTLPCYLYILYYAILGYRAGKLKKVPELQTA